MSKGVIHHLDARKREHPDDGPDWLGAPTSIDDLVDQAAHAGRDWSFGWIRLAQDARTDDLARALGGTGAVIVGAAGRLIRAKLPGDEARLQAIASLSEVDGLGAVPAETKLQWVAHDVSERPAHEQIPVFVTLMSSDPDGRWRLALKELGVVVGRFDPEIRVYAASAAYKVLEAIARADFVMAIEPVGIVTAAHDTAVPAMGADALRTYEGSPGLFSGVGGRPVPIAVMDTGLNISHLDISSNRSSICGSNFVFWEPRVDDQDLWVDAFGHGTHVTGTIAGNGTAEPRYAGMAPVVQHIRFAKVLNHSGSGVDVFILRGMDFLAQPTACPEAGWSSDSVKPLIVNMSLSVTSRVWEGRRVAERKLDSIVWGHRQLYVVAQSNAGISGFSNYGAAKNSLAVGAALDSGSLAAFSSHGPTADGRLAPQIVGTGVDLYSPAGDGSRDGYSRLSGTSMASPAVAGVSALLMEAIPAHREQPALARARLMASAIKPDAWLEDAEFFPTDNSSGPGKLQMQYGLGKVSARTSVLNKDEAGGWKSASAVSELEDGEYAYRDIQVPEGTSRLDLVLTWDEPPTDTVSSAVLNDLDLWIDRGGDCETEPCGEYASTSRVDNVEWIIVPNPPPGMYRAKVAATRVYTDAPRAALAWTTIRGASTPSLEIDVDNERAEVEHWNEEGELTLSLTVDEYVAAGTRLHIDCRTVEGAECLQPQVRVSTEREDGIEHEVQATILEPIAVGELAAGENWEAKVTFRNLVQDKVDAFRLYFKANAWNANSAATSILLRKTGANGTEVPEVAVPANDRFANAALIEGDEGSEELDLVLAGTESGEPAFTPFLGRPAASAWYQWTASSNDKVSFGVTPDSAYGSVHPLRVDVFRGDRIAALEPVASADWGAQFFSETGQVYRIRVSHARKSVPVVLNWSVGPRPSNDNFLTATVLDDASGSVDGTNAGATLEPGEFFGELASTVWYQWTAPSDGIWKFESSAIDLRVLAFAGDSLSDLRLVSGSPRDWAAFNVREGEVYWVAVASKDADAAGLEYELRWDSYDREPGNDDFSGAEEIPGEASSSHGVSIDIQSTVEPGEPIESGIRTRWWVWTPPEDGVYTWRLDELTRPTTGPNSRLMVSVFTGEALNDLQLVGTNGAEMSVEFVFSAVGGQRYWIAVGLPVHDEWAYMTIYRNASVTLTWGPTPANDSFASAVSLTGGSGSVTASNLFATTERGERMGKLGHSSLWWRYETSASGWYRFWIDNADATLTFAVYKAGDALASLELVDSRRGPDAEVVFQVEADSVYVIRVGTHGSAQGREFTLRWEETETPISLRYVGQLAPGGLDAAGNTVELRNLNSLALNDAGDALYLASELGLQVFERDSGTGQLTFVQTIEGYLYEHRELFWDGHRDRLLSVLCYEWYAFVPVNEESEKLRYDGRLTVSGNREVCNERSLFIDSKGSIIYAVARYPRRLQAYEFASSDNVRYVQTLGIDQLQAAVIANDDGHVYAVTSGSLLAFERDADSGELSQVSSRALSNGTALAVSDDDGFLFVLDDNGRRATVFDLAEDRNHPVLLGSVSHADSTSCGHATARPETPVIDVFCSSGYVSGSRAVVAYTVQWRSATGEIVISDRVRGSDEIGNAVPHFGNLIDVAESPDERYVYLATHEQGILIFERIGD